MASKGTVLRTLAMTSQLVPAPEREADGGLDDAVRRAQRGDVAAFETLYRRCAGRVHALCLRLCGDAAAAEALTQEAFVRAWEKLPGFRGEAAFPTWLHRLTVNLVLHDRRSRRRREDRERVHGEHAPSTERPQRAADAGMDLERAIASLPPGARTVFVLHEIEGYRHEEIAIVTGLSVGTSKAQLHLARRLLRRSLA